MKVLIYIIAINNTWVYCNYSKLLDTSHLCLNSLSLAGLVSFDMIITITLQ